VNVCVFCCCITGNGGVGGVTSSHFYHIVADVKNQLKDCGLVYTYNGGRCFLCDITTIIITRMCQRCVLCVGDRERLFYTIIFR